MPRATSPTRRLFFVAVVHMNSGWRYWAAECGTTFDVEHGLRSDGYGSFVEAAAAVRKIGGLVARPMRSAS